NQTFGFAGTFRARSAVRFHRWKRLFCWKEPQSHQGRDCEISTRPFGRSLRGPFEEGGGKAAAAKSIPSNPCQRLTRSCNLLPRQPELVAVQSRKLGEHASSQRGWRHGGVHAVCFQAATGGFDVRAVKYHRRLQLFPVRHHRLGREHQTAGLPCGCQAASACLTLARQVRMTSVSPSRHLPDCTRVPAREIVPMHRWIALGFVLFSGVSQAQIPEQEHWAFRPVGRPSPPRVAAANWARNPIDRFVLAKLEAAGLKPASEADKATLLRRFKFDLLGLPPTPEEIDAFVADTRPDAYERLVERYLASPHYGERWARHWLDVVRFAESHGFEMNQPRTNAWPYRDYVIQSLNEDKPYDRFVVEQLAGDALGVDEATGFLVAGPWDQVKSPDIGLTLMQRADELHDIVNTTGTAFLGLTVGCARCHDHKFDPISQRDYYGIKAMFAGVEHGERALSTADTEKRKQEAEELRRQIARVSADLDAQEPLAQPNGPANRRRPVDARKNVERFEPLTAKFVRFSILATNNLEPCLDELEVFASGSTPRNVALASAGAKALSSGDYAAARKIHRLQHINDGRYGNSRSWISSEFGKGWVQIELKEPASIDRIVWGRDREGKFKDRLATQYRIE